MVALVAELQKRSDEIPSPSLPSVFVSLSCVIELGKLYLPTKTALIGPNAIVRCQGFQEGVPLWVDTIFGDS